MQSKEFEFLDYGKWTWFYKIHGAGLRSDTEVNTRIWFSLETISRHRYYKHITHIYNIQRITLAQA